MADITWSAYALAMFTPEQRAAAVSATYEPPDTSRPIPPVTPLPGIRDSSSFSPIAGLDPNNPADLKLIHQAGWRYEGGRWLNGSMGVAANPDGLPPSQAGRPAGAFFATAAVIPGGSVLGFQIPTAPAVLLPSFVGGRLGRVSLGEGLRPEAGGSERVRIGRMSMVRGMSI